MSYREEGKICELVVKCTDSGDADSSVVSLILCELGESTGTFALKATGCLGNSEEDRKGALEAVDWNISQLSLQDN